MDIQDSPWQPKHHTASALPAMSMADFKAQGGNLDGRTERTDAFAGQPKAVGGTLGGHGAKGTTSLTDPDPSRQGHNHDTGINGNARDTGINGNAHDTHHSTTTHKPSLMDKLNPMKDADGDGKRGFMD